MDFRFLFDPTRNLFAIGYRVADGELDANYYDLLASEARLASFVAIAKGDVPPAHWFRLGRAMTPVDRGSALVSWSGSMFEYLMPELVMRVAGGQPAGADVPPRRPPPDPVRLRARRPVGHLGIGVQRPRPRPHVPVLELRRPGPRPRARPQRGPRRRALRHRAGRHDGRPGGGAEPVAARRGRRARRLRLLRGARLHREPRAGGRHGGAGPRVHGAPPGHDAGRHPERAARRPHAPALPRRAHRAGQRPAPAGAHAAGRRGRPARDPTR